VAADSFHRWREDLGLVASLGLSTYRLSVSWPRVLPRGIGAPSTQGIAYYRALLEECRALGIVPIVTLSHWDMPAGLELERGGWTNPDSVDWFLHFARTCFTELGDLVPRWITFNEPLATAFQGYELGIWPPGLSARPGRDIYTVARHVLLAHAATHRLYHGELGLPGQVGITLNTNWFEPETEGEEAAAEQCLQFYLGLFAAPLLEGDWPLVVRERVGNRSAAQGLPASRLPPWSPEEQDWLRGSTDFLGLNHYTSSLAASYPFPPEDESAVADMGARFSSSPAWYSTGSGLGVVPPGIRRLLDWVRSTYDNPPVIITENGVADRLGNLEDMERLYYHRHYINQVLKAVRLDGCNVLGYIAWSLLDNWEWSFGYRWTILRQRCSFPRPGVLVNVTLSTASLGSVAALWPGGNWLKARQAE
jgi:lactase-phlorizin hydrolase